MKELPSRPPTDKAKGAFHIVASRFNTQYGGWACRSRDRRAAGTCAERDDSVHRVPGSFEIPVVARQLAAQHQADTIVACGVILQGETNHAKKSSRSVTERCSESP